jgi:hypothetical protein
MMNHGTHSYLMLGVVAVGAVLLLTGNVGGWLLLLWPVACMAMMVWMMWGMRGMGAAAPAPTPAEHAHEDGLVHAHR